MLVSSQEDLWVGFKRAQLANHSVLRGGVREEAVRLLLNERLPRQYRVVTGEVVDRNDQYSAQADAIVIDQARNPVFREGDSVLVPAEALLGMIEIKSKLTAREMAKAVAAAQLIRKLQPFGGSFVGARQKGTKAGPGTHRCFVTLFAYRSDLGVGSDWASREWDRYIACLASPSDRDLIDRIVVLDRGMLNPPFARGKNASDEKRVLHEWFVGFANFLERERARRKPMDWQVYLDRYSSGWVKL